MTKQSTVHKRLVIDAAGIHEAGLIYRALYHPLRLKIIDLIHKAGKISVSKLNKKLKEDKSLLSQQLKILRDADILVTKREGKQVVYSVNGKQIDKIQKLSEKVIALPRSTPVTISRKEIESIKERVAKPKKAIFSPNELQIIQLICEQQTSEEIGERMKLSKRTIEDYRTRIIQKMHMRNTVGLVLYAVRNQLVTL